METSMKFGLIVLEGTEKEVRKEYSNLLEKAIAGYGDLVSEFEDDVLGTFRIETDDIKITFSMSKYFRDKYAIYQIFE